MCDLIDLNSPDSRKLQAISKLASPLIPGPPTPSDKPNTVDFVSNEKHSGVDNNNPFDAVFKETAEYVAKKNDPFETASEKAEQNARRDTPRGCRYKEDFTPKRKRHSDILRMNKTLDEPLLHGILNKNFQLSKHQNERKVDSQRLNSPDDFQSRIANPLGHPDILVCPPSPGNCSVLNQSAMNDTLSETGCGSEGGNEGDEGVFIPVENGRDALTEGVSHSEIEDVLSKSKHRRSLSQGNKMFPEPSEMEREIISRPRSRSTMDTLRVNNSQSKSRVSSVTSADSCNIDFGNNAFMETPSQANSESFDFSRISATPRSGYSSSGSVGSLYSCGSKNRAFILESQTSGGIFGNTSSAKSSFDLSSISRSTGAGNLLIKTPLKTPVRITDLELRFERIKLQSMGSVGGLPLYSPNRKVQSFLRSDGTESADGKSQSLQEREAKLIDTDGYEGDGCNFGNFNCSSDSVFIENNNVDQSVFREAKILARTFDELAHQSASNSFSSGDDLLYSRPRWNFDILPVSDDEEPPVDNLIELPLSPMKNEDDIRSTTKKDDQQNIEKKDKAESRISEEIRDLENQFIDQDITRNKVMAATLLLDLEKIVHRENNPEAITLLENLEKVLGVKYESNAQLLATCLQETNNLNKSPKKCFNKVVLNENIRHESLEKSDEDNNDAELSNSNETPKIRNDDSLGLNLNIETAINKSEKSVTVDLSIPNEEKKENSSEKSKNIKNDLENKQKEILIDENEALELITNLSKILGGPNNDSSPLSLLTNLRQVLNLATNQLNFENSQVTKFQNQETPKIVKTGIATSQKKPFPKPKIDAMKLGRKKSIDGIVKVQNNAPGLMKRSMSFGSAQNNVALTAAVSKEKTKTPSRTFKKATSYEAVPKPDKLEKASSMVPEVGRSRASTVGGTAKYKLKKNSESDSVAGKKGPLKALLPVGKMQRRGSMSEKVAPISLSRTPPKSTTAAPTTFQLATSSTPNPPVTLTISKKSPKTKPVASSTPDGAGSKARRMRLQFSKNNTKPKFSCNISPVTPLPTHSITGNMSSKGTPKNHRHNRTLSPPKRRSSQEALALNTTESSIPKYSPLSGFSRRNSKETVKTMDHSGSPRTSSAKSQTPKKTSFVHSKSESQILQSPLKTMNNQNAKFKPFNLISKLRRGSNGSNASDKENCA